MVESQNIEWKESWRDEYQNGYVVLLMLKVEKYILVVMMMGKL